MGRGSIKESGNESPSLGPRVKFPVGGLSLQKMAIFCSANYTTTRMWAMPNMTVALPNIGGALCNKFFFRLSICASVVKI